jgi:hypothetical protein
MDLGSDYPVVEGERSAGNWKGNGVLGAKWEIELVCGRKAQKKSMHNHQGDLYSVHNAYLA